MRQRGVIAIGVAGSWTAALALLGGCPQPSSGSGAAETPTDTGAAYATALTTTTVPCQDAAATASQPCYLNDPWDADASRGRFFHLSEGSEIFPYPWLLALDTDAGAAFFDTSHPPYGLLQDPKDPGCDADTCNRYGQPVGMTVAKTRDLAWLGLEMFGFNCAACHVGELTAQGKTFRVVGGPNMFDIIGFLTGFKASIAYTVASVDSVLAFVARVAANALAANVDPSLERRLQFARKVSSLAQLESASPANGLLTAAVQKAFAEFKAQHPVRPALAHVVPGAQSDRTAWVPLRSGSPAPIGPYLAVLSEQLRPTARSAAAKPPRAARTPELPRLISAKDAADALQYLSDVGEILALLLQRLDDVERILNGGGAGVPITAPGPGRVDAFMMTHNSLFPSEPAAPMTSPVDYPRLWGLLAMHWFHWDGNTDSLLERNVGQALGLGAIVDPANSQSTIQIANIEELETLASKISRPMWPFAIDDAQLDSGAAVFRQHCQRCHDADAGIAVMPASAIGTDPLREKNFAMNMAPDGSFDGAPFVSVLASELKQVVAQALQSADGSASGPDLDASWRLTNGYVERPLDGVWATAPYLHNGSVATIDDLLTAPDARPHAYMAGSRAYDTSRMGYEGNGTFLFDAGAPGNSASGHEYGIDASPADKAALKEYLKKL